MVFPLGEELELGQPGHFWLTCLSSLIPLVAATAQPSCRIPHLSWESPSIYLTPRQQREWNHPLSTFVLTPHFEVHFGETFKLSGMIWTLNFWSSVTAMDTLGTTCLLTTTSMLYSPKTCCSWLHGQEGLGLEFIHSNRSLAMLPPQAPLTSQSFVRRRYHQI